jgi:outer membrane protein TolC
MNGAGLVRKISPALPSFLALCLALSAVGVESSWVQAQSPSLQPMTAPPPLETSSTTVGETSSLPASAVSPFIERFVKANGREVSGSMAPPSVPRPLPVPSQSPSPPVPPSPASPQPFRDRAGANRSAGAGNPLATDMMLKPAPFDPGDKRFPINLATALRLSDARPLVVAAAQTSVWIAEAELTRAKVLWVPSLTFAADYIRHDGGGPDFNKGILTSPSLNYFYAGPSLFQYINLTDAIFQPLAARQVLNSRHFDVQTAKNDALLRTSDAYFYVHQFRGTYAGALYTVERGHLLVDRITELGRELVPTVEIERAKNLLADLEQRAASARQEWRVQSANLTQVLRLDPRAVVEPMESDHAQVTLIDPGREIDELMSIALKNRPELSSRRALVEAAEYRVRREKARPLLPLVMLNGFQTSGGMMIQAGVFGLGPGNDLNQWKGRDDVSIQCMWQLEGFGIGNMARIKAQRGEQSRSVIDLRRTQDMVVGDVTRARARVQSAAVRVLQADRALRTGIITFNGQLAGLSQTRRFGDVLTLVNRPQEAVYSLKLLNTAFEEYFSTVGEYNRAEFELFHALGYPAREVAQLRPPGEYLPVDTSRPSFLPAVGNGPPPATH